MKKAFICLSLSILCFILGAGCKKSSNNDPSPFALSLAKTCTKPFVGHGDSSNIYLPTAFTPNGDGINDVYRILGESCLSPGYFLSFLLTVYDTTGALVYQSNHVSQIQWYGLDTATGKLSTKYKFYVKISYTTAGNITDSGGTYVYLLSTDTLKHCINRMHADTAKYQLPDQFDPITGFNPAYPSFEQFCN